MQRDDQPEDQREAPKKANPRPADEQDSPEPERPRTIREAEGQAIKDLEDPPKAEGNRDEAEAPDDDDR